LLVEGLSGLGLSHANPSHCHELSQHPRIDAIIAPPVPPFSNNLRTIDDLIDHTVGRVLDLFSLEARGCPAFTAVATNGPRLQGS
jgi:3-polyprenyl-4-hydroxybenzoate decarboxylase